MKSTNYYNTFIEIADDCPVGSAEVPVQRGTERSVPLLQYEMIIKNPYYYTQDDVLFEIFARRNNVDSSDAVEREKFFSKDQACLRASSLGKRYGWGIHCDENGKVAIYPVESDEYKKLKNDPALTHLKAMRTSRKK